jgi:lysine 2,3-aminomutase
MFMKTESPARKSSARVFPSRLSPSSFIHWNNWQWQVQHRIRDVTTLKQWIHPTSEEKKAIQCARSRFPFAITPHLAHRMHKDNPACPLRKQFVPSIEECRAMTYELRDPCAEEAHMAAPGLIHRYADRAELLITDDCAAYCRFCTRKRFVGNTFRKEEVTPASRQDHYAMALRYIAEHPLIREIVLSGGDPLMLPDEAIDQMLAGVRAIAHVKLIRIDTRIPVTMPQRITRELCGILKKYHPVFMEIHINHPAEIAPETRDACNQLSDAGIPLSSCTVLLKGINDSCAVLKNLMQELQVLRMRPYGLYQCGLVIGAEQFRTSVGTGMSLIASLHAGMPARSDAVPAYMVTIPNSGETIRLETDTLLSRHRHIMILKNYNGKLCLYPDHGQRAASTASSIDDHG